MNVAQSCGELAARALVSVHVVCLGSVEHDAFEQELVVACGEVKAVCVGAIGGWLELTDALTGRLEDAQHLVVLLDPPPPLVHWPRLYALGVPDVAHLTAFVIAALTIAVIPGPGMLYVLARTLGGGRDVGLRSSIGTGFGGLVHVGLAAAGLSAVIAASATAFTAVKFLGAAYLIWLGCRALFFSDREPPLGVLGGAPESGDGAMRQGAITELLNPKTALFFLTFLPQFCQPEHGPLLVQVAVLGTVSVVMNTLADVVVALAAGHVRARLHRRPRVWRRQQIATGSILVGLGAYAAASGHRAS